MRMFALVLCLGVLGTGVLAQDDAVEPKPVVWERGQATLANGEVEITLSKYFRDNADLQKFNLLLSCKGSWSPLYSTAPTADGKVTVKTTSDGSATQSFYWEAKATVK